MRGASMTGTTVDENKAIAARLKSGGEGEGEGEPSPEPEQEG